MQVESEVYGAIIGYLEELELELTYKGNAHHLAQKLAALVKERGTLGLIEQNPYLKGEKLPCGCTSKQACWTCLHTLERLRNEEREEKERYISYAHQLQDRILVEGQARLETAKFISRQRQLLPRLRRVDDEIE
jgi:hypothetical protein